MRTQVLQGRGGCSKKVRAPWGSLACGLPPKKGDRPRLKSPQHTRVPGSSAPHSCPCHWQEPEGPCRNGRNRTRAPLSTFQWLCRDLSLSTGFRLGGYRGSLTGFPIGIPPTLSEPLSSPGAKGPERGLTAWKGLPPGAGLWAVREERPRRREWGEPRCVPLLRLAGCFWIPGANKSPSGPFAEFQLGLCKLQPKNS